MPKRLILLVEITSPPPLFGGLSIVNSLTQPTFGAATSQTLLASGGSGLLTWQLLGNVPPGISINRNTGVVSGAWNTRGSFNFYARVADAVGQFATRAFSWAIADEPPVTTDCDPYTLQTFDAADAALNESVTVLPFDAANGHLCNTVLED